MPTTYRYAAYGWVHPGHFAPTVLIGRYRTRTCARIAAWWWRWTEWDAHSWVRPEHAVVHVQDGRSVG